MDWKTVLAYISGSVDEELLVRNCGDVDPPVSGLAARPLAPSPTTTVFTTVFVPVSTSATVFPLPN